MSAASTHRNIVTVLALLIAVFAAAGLGGCADLQGAIARTTAWRADAQGLRDDLGGQLAQLQAHRDSLPPDSPDGPAIDAAIGATHAKLSALDAAIAHADLVLEEAANPSDSLTRLAHGISAWVPAPAQGPLILGAALAATFMRSRQLKAGAASIIRSIDHVMQRDDQFREVFARHADTIRTIQTPAARRLVDATTAPGRAP
ncbi:MAG: hypothetical protein WD114_04030 [Phycisphaerales bacterium]